MADDQVNGIMEDDAAKSEFTDDNVLVDDDTPKGNESNEDTTKHAQGESKPEADAAKPEEQSQEETLEKQAPQHIEEVAASTGEGGSIKEQNGEEEFSKTAEDTPAAPTEDEPPDDQAQVEVVPDEAKEGSQETTDESNSDVVTEDKPLTKEEVTKNIEITDIEAAGLEQELEQHTMDASSDESQPEPVETRICVAVETTTTEEEPKTIEESAKVSEEQRDEETPEPSSDASVATPVDSEPVEEESKEDSKESKEQQEESPVEEPQKEASAVASIESQPSEEESKQEEETREQEEPTEEPQPDATESTVLSTVIVTSEIVEKEPKPADDQPKQEDNVSGEPGQQKEETVDQKLEIGVTVIQSELSEEPKPLDETKETEQQFESIPDQEPNEVPAAVTTESEGTEQEPVQDDIKETIHISSDVSVVVDVESGPAEEDPKQEEETKEPEDIAPQEVLVAVDAVPVAAVEEEKQAEKEMQVDREEETPTETLQEEVKSEFTEEQPKQVKGESTAAEKPMSADEQPTQSEGESIAFITTEPTEEQPKQDEPDTVIALESEQIPQDQEADAEEPEPPEEQPKLDEGEMIAVIEVDTTKEQPKEDEGETVVVVESKTVEGQPQQEVETVDVVVSITTEEEPKQDREAVDAVESVAIEEPKQDELETAAEEAPTQIDEQLDEISADEPKQEDFSISVIIAAKSEATDQEPQHLRDEQIEQTSIEVEHEVTETGDIATEPNQTVVIAEEPEESQEDQSQEELPADDTKQDVTAVIPVESAEDEPMQAEEETKEQEDQKDASPVEIPPEVMIDIKTSVSVSVETKIIETEPEHVEAEVKETKEHRQELPPTDIEPEKVPAEESIIITMDTERAEEEPKEAVDGTKELEKKDEMPAVDEIPVAFSVDLKITEKEKVGVNVVTQCQPVVADKGQLSKEEDKTQEKEEVVAEAVDTQSTDEIGDTGKEGEEEAIVKVKIPEEAVQVAEGENYNNIVQVTELREDTPPEVMAANSLGGIEDASMTVTVMVKKEENVDDEDKDEDDSDGEIDVKVERLSQEDQPLLVDDESDEDTAAANEWMARVDEKEILYKGDVVITSSIVSTEETQQESIDEEVPVEGKPEQIKDEVAIIADVKDKTLFSGLEELFPGEEIENIETKPRDVKTDVYLAFDVSEEEDTDDAKEVVEKTEVKDVAHTIQEEICAQEKEERQESSIELSWMDEHVEQEVKKYTTTEETPRSPVDHDKVLESIFTEHDKNMEQKPTRPRSVGESDRGIAVHAEVERLDKQSHEEVDEQIEAEEKQKRRSQEWSLLEKWKELEEKESPQKGDRRSFEIQAFTTHETQAESPSPVFIEQRDATRTESEPPTADMKPAHSTEEVSRQLVKVQVVSSTEKHKPSSPTVLEYETRETSRPIVTETETIETTPSSVTKVTTTRTVSKSKIIKARTEVLPESQTPELEVAAQASDRKSPPTTPTHESKSVATEMVSTVVVKADYIDDQGKSVEVEHETPATPTKVIVQELEAPQAAKPKTVVFTGIRPTSVASVASVRGEHEGMPPLANAEESDIDDSCLHLAKHIPPKTGPSRAPADEPLVEVPSPEKGPLSEDDKPVLVILTEEKPDDEDKEGDKSENPLLGESEGKDKGQKCCVIL